MINREVPLSPRMNRVNIIDKIYDAVNGIVTNYHPEAIEFLRPLFVPWHELIVEINVVPWLCIAPVKISGSLAAVVYCLPIYILITSLTSLMRMKIKKKIINISKRIHMELLREAMRNKRRPLIARDSHFDVAPPMFLTHLLTARYHLW